MPDKLGTRIRYSFRFTAQGCLDAGGEDAVDPRCGEHCAVVLVQCVGPHVAFSIFDKT